MNVNTEVNATEGRRERGKEKKRTGKRRKEENRGGGRERGKGRERQRMRNGKERNERSNISHLQLKSAISPL